ncbi:ricin-type beta-trefoil lectin domain protein [Streptomyces sp. NBC_01092]|uniref:ricin-type beta-trefoil lectin domain protein n=1 Tax=Streptomyces sp. NBC_01092 TaxID=2903748 RepID=UPI00386CC388|nr:RICIN domain-containing protein [Streptomyces sp. NBC_01092]
MTSLLRPRPPPRLRLLADRPEPQRTQLLDHLFKTGYDAALQTLKLEVGGDTNSTHGAEPSHMRTRDTVDCGQGYQWWIAEQAKARTAAKNWWWGNDTLRLGGPNGKCVDVEKEGTGDGTPVHRWDCNGGPNQQWTPQTNGGLKGVQSGRCLDASGLNTTNGTQLVIWD